MLRGFHDEVVHGKGSLIQKPPGDEWQKRATLRCLFGYMWASSGKKLLFMGGELGQWHEWSHEAEVEWHLLGDRAHAGIRHWIGDLNRVYRDERSLHARDCDPRGFEWVEANDAANSVLAFLRTDGEDEVLCVFNWTSLPRLNYRLGVPGSGTWREILNSDARDYGGSGWGSMGTVESAPVPYHGRTHSVVLTLPALAAIFLKRIEGGVDDDGSRGIEQGSR